MPGRGHARKIVRSRFRVEEDTRLRLLVAQLGTQAWAEIAARMPGRNVRQCRDRWSHYLADMPMAAVWTPCDDALLRRMVNEVGPRWDRIAIFFPDRSPHDVHRRWATIGIPCADAAAEPPPAPDVARMAEMQTQMDDWSGDPFFPRDYDPELRGLGDGVWLTPMQDSWTQDLL
jgi:hypothetical protein